MPSRRTKSSAVNERISQAQKERTHLACVLCRSRRIKCDGRPGTCGRCLADQRTDCRYENVGLAERLAGRKRKRALRKQNTDEGLEGTVSLAGLSSQPLPTNEARRETSSSISSVSTSPSLHRHSDNLQNVSVPPGDEREKAQKQYQHHYHHLLHHYHNNQSRQGQDVNAWSPTLASSSGPTFSLDDHHQSRPMFHPSTMSSAPPMKEYSRDAPSYDVPLSSNGMLAGPSVLTKPLHFGSDIGPGQMYTTSHSTGEESNTPTAWMGRSAPQMEYLYQAGNYSSYPITSQGDNVRHFGSPHQPHPQSQALQPPQQHSQQLSPHQQQQQQGGKSGVESSSIAPGVPEQYLANSDLDLSSVDGLWRVDDWQYRSGTSTTTRGTDHNAQPFASVNSLLDPRMGLTRGGQSEQHGS